MVLGHLTARLAAVDRARPGIDRARGDEALARHLRMLGLAGRPVGWAPDAETAYASSEALPEDQVWLSAVSHAAVLADPANKGMGWTAARNAIWPLCWSPAETEVRMTFRTPKTTAAAARLRHSARKFRSVVSAVATAATWLTAAPDFETTRRRQGRERCAAIWEPFIDLYEAGLWLFLIGPDRVVAVPRPAIRTDAQGRLHADDGPAVHWTGGTSHYFWHGVQVDEGVIAGAVTVQDLLAERSAGVRNAMVERLGYERLVLELALAPFHVDEVGALYRVSVPQGEPLAFVHVRNSTREPDGSWKWYFLRVPPDMSTARGAVAWTFGLHPGEYAPTRET